MDTKIILCYALRFLLCCTFIACISTASHTISPGQSLSGVQTITSPSGTFELGFYKPDALPFNLSDYLGTFTRATLEINGQLKFYAWYQDCRTWKLISTEPSDQCEVNVSCGAFSICNQRWYPHCRCLEGFGPKVKENWRLEEFSDSCVRKIPFHYSPGDSFLAITNVAYPQNFKEIFHVSIDQCRLECLINCSCTAIAYNFSDSRRCYMWIGDLHNIRTTPYGSDFIRFFSILSSTFMVMVFFRRRWSARALATTGDSLVLYKHRDSRRATKNSSQKLGEGALGSVFKAMLPNSTTIAVKELKSMNQGEKQFRAEVGTIGVIQHINLIRLRGFYTNASKRFLV
ncbi:hypothetical protein FF2_013686 [Malus domestica]